MEKEYKKLWKITAVIETNTGLTATNIRSRIDFGVNDGDGMYFDVSRKNCKIELTNTVEDK